MSQKNNFSDISLADLIATKEMAFFVSQTQSINFNQSCKSSLAVQVEESRRAIVEELWTCYGRNTTLISQQLNYLEEETKNLILKKLHLDNEEWEVIYNFSNTTHAIKTACDIIFEQKDNRKVKCLVNEMSHASLFSSFYNKANSDSNYIFNTYKIDPFYNDINIETSDKRKSLQNEFEDYKYIIALPIIDNLFGINHLDILMNTNNFYTLLCKSSRNKNVFDGNLDIILDGAQSLQSIIFPDFNNRFSLRYEDNIQKYLKYVSAITFGTHKFHGGTMGILVIKKSKLNITNYNNFAVGGGSISSYNKPKIDSNNIALTFDNKEILGGSKRIEDFISFGAFLAFLLIIFPKQIQNIKNGKRVYKISFMKNNLVVLNNLSKFIKLIGLKNIEVVLPDSEYLNSIKYYKSHICLIKSKHLPSQIIYTELLKDNIETRFGEFCNQIYFSKYGGDYVRISSSIANTLEDFEELKTSLVRIDSLIDNILIKKNK